MTRLELNKLVKFVFIYLFYNQHKYVQFQWWLSRNRTMNLNCKKLKITNNNNLLEPIIKFLFVIFAAIMETFHFEKTLDHFKTLPNNVRWAIRYRYNWDNGLLYNCLMEIIHNGPPYLEDNVIFRLYTLDWYTKIDKHLKINNNIS